MAPRRIEGKLSFEDLEVPHDWRYDLFTDENWRCYYLMYVWGCPDPECNYRRASETGAAGFYMSCQEHPKHDLTEFLGSYPQYLADELQPDPPAPTTLF